MFLPCSTMSRVLDMRNTIQTGEVVLPRPPAPLPSLPLSPRWSGPPRPPGGAEPGCTGRGSLAGFQSDG